MADSPKTETKVISQKDMLLGMLYDGSKEDWNAYRAAHSGIRLDLREADLVGRDLTNYDFSECDLMDARFCHSNLTAVSFERACLRGADFSGVPDAKLAMVIWKSVDAHGAKGLTFEAREKILNDLCASWSLPD
jgi:uncharacterized protein YjbI with pentapeptide repeats